MALNIKWNKKAIQQFDTAITFIEKESISGAEKVKKEILAKIDALMKNPEQYTADKYKTNNDGSFRAFEVHHYRISYRYIKSDVRIIRIRHTKMNPLTY